MAYQYYQCPLCERRYRAAEAATRGWVCCGVRLQAVSAAVAPSSPAVRQVLYEILPARDSATAGLAAENLFATLGATVPYSLEIWSEHTGHHFLVRTTSDVTAQVLGPIRGVYPRADMRPLPCAQPGDPTFLNDGEVAVAVELRLELPNYLPLATFQRDDDFVAADPLAVLLGGQAALTPDERLLSQIILRPAPSDWGRGWLSLAEDPNPFATPPAMRTWMGNARALVMLLLVCGGGAGVVMTGLHLFARHFLDAGLFLVGTVVVSGLLYMGMRYLGRRAIVDPKLVRQKLTSGPGFYVWIRLIAIGADRRYLVQRLQQQVMAYRQLQHGLGNALRAHDLPPLPAYYDLYTDPLAWSFLGRQARPPWRRLPILTARELAGLWHLPHRDVDLPLVERPRYRRILPPLAKVRDGELLGREEHQGRAVPIRLPLADLQKHTLTVGKTQRGKSTFMGHLVGAAIREGTAAILVVDPHSDMVRRVLSQVPPQREGDVVYIDLSDTARPPGINLLDMRAGRSRQTIMDNLMTNFARIWADYWGPRMSDVFRHALSALLEVNENLPEQFTLLDVNGMLQDHSLREFVLQQIRDPLVRSFWADDLWAADPRRWEEITRPVVDKINFFAIHDVTRHIFGQSATTLNLPELLRQGRVILVNTAAGVVGQEAAAIAGATMVDVVVNFLQSQSALAAAERRPVMVVIDEFHLLPANYETFIAELAKYGGHLVLGTQNLRQFDTFDRAQSGGGGRALRSRIFGNISNLYVFQSSAEDADLLVDELDQAVTVVDITNLDDHACYVKVSKAGQRLPAFSMTTVGPPPLDPDRIARLAAASAQQYGRPREEVQREIVQRMLTYYGPHWQPPDLPLPKVGTEAQLQRGVVPAAQPPPADPENPELF